MSTEPGAMEAAFRDEAGEAGPVMGGGTSEQLELLRNADGKLPQDAFRRLRAMNGPGRRPGSRNKRNTDLAKLICQKSGDPLLFLSSVYATDLDQLVEMLMIAEGVPEREDRLNALCDDVATLVSTAAREGWGEARLKILDRMLAKVESAASSLKAKPGEIALKALGHQLQAAKEVAPYVHSKKPTEITATHKVDGVIFMPGPQATAADPIGEVMKRTAEAISSGAIQAEQIMDLRFNETTGSYELGDGGESEV